jgi:replicative DNA helicase
VVDRCCLTLAYAVQPDVIRGLAGKPSFRGRGLIGRFLYALPENNLGNRSIDPDPMPGNVVDQYDQLIRRLSEIVPGDEPMYADSQNKEL